MYGTELPWGRLFLYLLCPSYRKSRNSRNRKDENTAIDRPKNYRAKVANASVRTTRSGPLRGFPGKIILALLRYFSRKPCLSGSICSKGPCSSTGCQSRKYSINSLVYWVTYVHNVVYSFYRSMIYCYINSTQRCAGSIVIDIIPTNGADKRKFFPFAPYFPVTNVIKRYFYPYFPAIIGIKGYSFPYFPYLSGIMKIKTALYSLFSRLDWHKTVVFPCLGEIYEGIRSLSWEIPVT